MQSCRTLLERAGAWFLRSGIQSPEGGVARYYRSDLRENARVSAEITGYAVSFLVDLSRRLRCAEYLDAGLRAARFLTRSAWDSDLQLFPFEPAAVSPAYFFDSGIIVRGLLAAWRESGESEFLDTAIAAGRGMLAHFRSKDSIHPILTLPDRTPSAYGLRWSNAPGCYQLKAAMAWNDLFEATGEAAFRRAYEEALQTALDSHACFLPGNAEAEGVMDRLHAYAYFLEGILPRAGQAECRAALGDGIGRTGWYLREISPAFARSDVYAQLLRVRLFAAQAGAAPLDEAAASEEAAKIPEFQFDSRDGRVHGGFAFGVKRGETLPYVNPVSTAFCAQAAAMWCEHRNNGPVPNLLALV